MTLLNYKNLKLALGIAAAMALLLLIHDRNRWKSAAELRQQQVLAEKAAHSATAANYRAAAAQAREADAANSARVRAEQARINERTAHDFESRIAAARAASDRLRSHAAASGADPGAGGTADLPRLSASAGSPVETARHDGLPDTERLIATEQAIQLDELIKWVRRQHEVPADRGSPAR